MLDRADDADFGWHNSIRLEAEHFLNTLNTPLYILFGTTPPPPPPPPQKKKTTKKPPKNFKYLKVCLNIHVITIFGEV